MLACAYIIADTQTRLNRMYEKLRRIKDFDFDLKYYRETAKSIMEDALLAFQELQISGAMAFIQISDMKEILDTSLKRIETERPEEFLSILKDYSSSASISPYSISASTMRYDFRELYKLYGYGGQSFGFDDITTQLVFRSVKSKTNREIYVLDCNVKTASYVKSLREMNPNIKFYAAGLAENNINEIRAAADKIAVGTLKGSSISNDAFDIMFFVPPLTMQKVEAMFLANEERDFIRYTAKYLRPGGYAIFLIPTFKLYSATCTTISRFYTDVQIRKTIDFENTGLVVVTGKKRATMSADTETSFETLRAALHPEKIISIMLQDFEPMELPQATTEIKLFKGSILSDDEMLAFYEASSAKKAFWKKQESIDKSKQIKYPPLTFTKGQMGLVLVSDSLGEGVIREKDGYVHLVKGRVVRRTDKETTSLENNIRTTEEKTYSRVELNLLLPNGEHKVLA